MYLLREKSLCFSCVAAPSLAECSAGVSEHLQGMRMRETEVA